MSKPGFARLVLAMTSVAVIGAVGYLLGTSLGRHRNMDRQQARQVEMQMYFEKNVRGIQLGEHFPEFQLLSASDSTIESSVEVLNGEGLFIYLSGTCESCVAAVQDLWTTIETLPRAKPVAIILQGPSAALASYLTDHEISIPVHFDLHETLSREFRVSTVPTYFAIDSSGVIVEMHAGNYDSQELAVVLTP